MDATDESKELQIEPGIRAKNVCTPEDLIIQKVVSERRKDWDDIEIIVKRQSVNLDREYLLKHCRDLSDLMERPDIFSTMQSLLNEA